MYEQAYLTYYRNDFAGAEKSFLASADASTGLVGRQVSLAKAVEARFQALMSKDAFTMNLQSLADQHNVDVGALRNIQKDLENQLNEFNKLRNDLKISRADREDAARWISNCLLHLADITIEIGEIAVAEEYLIRESKFYEEINHLTIKPVLDYLIGRMHLINGDSKASEQLYNACEGYKRLKREEGVADALITWGDALWGSDQQPKALEVYRKVANDVNLHRRNIRGISTAEQRLHMFGGS